MHPAPSRAAARTVAPALLPRVVPRTAACTIGPELQIEVAVDSSRCTVRLDGELDLATSARLHATLNLVCAGEHPLVVVDVGGLRFLSVAGARALAEAQAILHAAGRRMLLADPDRLIVRVLAITGLDQKLHVGAEPEQVTPEGATEAGFAVHG